MKIGQAIDLIHQDQKVMFKCEDYVILKFDIESQKIIAYSSYNGKVYNPMQIDFLNRDWVVNKIDL